MALSYNDPKRKGPVIRNAGGKNRHGTNCNDDSRVIVGMPPGQAVPYSMSVQKSISNYILKYDLKCTVLQFHYAMNLRKLAEENKLSQELMSALAIYWDWRVICRTQKLSEAFMEKHKKHISWKVASEYQSFSKSFILKHIDDLDMDVIINQRFLVTQEEVDERKKQLKKLEKYDSGEIDDRFGILDL